MKIIIPSVFFLIISTVFISCEHEKPDASMYETVCFDTEVLPVFQNKCAVCHNQSSPEGGYVFSDYTSIMKAIVPGNPEKSKAYEYITAIIHDFMPPDEPLTIYERTKIRLWIEQGANETKCYVPDTTNNQVIDSTVCFSRDILPIFISSCALSGCHDAVTHQGDYILDSYNNVMNGVELVVPFNPLNSKIYEVLIATGEDRMPPDPNAPLTSEQIAMIYDWINEGALDEDCPILCDTSQYTYSAVIEPLIFNNCKGCHSGATPNAGVYLTNYDQIKAVADDGRLVDVINQANGKPLMPPSGTLSGCQIQQIENWVNAGAPNNK